MDYSVTCECGHQIGVTASQAGAELTCRCGANVVVPRMSQLRKAAGQSAIPISTADMINKMVASGELPLDGLCPLSQRPADDTLYVRATCERSWTRGGDEDSGQFAIMMWLLGGWLGYLIAKRSLREQAEHLGRDTVVDLPIRIASEARSKYGWQPALELRSLLAKTPIYATLFKEFPDAKLTVLPRESVDV